MRGSHCVIFGDFDSVSRFLNVYMAVFSFHVLPVAVLYQHLLIYRALRGPNDVGYFQEFVCFSSNYLNLPSPH